MNEINKHFDEVATWMRARVIRHIEEDHGGVADHDAPWQNHRLVHWRDTENVHFDDRPKIAEEK